MSRITMRPLSEEQKILDDLYLDIQRRIGASAQGMCPADMSESFVSFCTSQSCGKCVPCRVGLSQVQSLLRQILDGEGTEEKVNLLERTARVIAESADCAIGYQAGELVEKAVKAFRDDFMNHVHNGQCLNVGHAVPCVTMCPAHVDIPGYIALCRDGRFADALRVIRKDNPFPSTCGLICEHPCEFRCRRSIIDEPINIKGIKDFVRENAGDIPVPQAGADTGKKVAVVGGGPAGLTAAYYLRLMGHAVTIFETRKKLGGMLLYGVPSYRLPREKLEMDVNNILSTGIDVRFGVRVGTDLSMEQLHSEFDAVFVGIGAHDNKPMGIEGEDARGHIPSVAFLGEMAEGREPDFKGKKVVIVGGGNVAMDVARTSMRLGAESVKIVYRRRRKDMPALELEIEGAIAENCELVTMMAPLKIETDADENVKALWVSPQISGPIDLSNRPTVRKADSEPERIECDIIISAIGQAVAPIIGIKSSGGRVNSEMDCSVPGRPGLFAGGDAVTGPATVIKAIAGGKAAAANIDQYLGFNHEIVLDVEIPTATVWDRVACGRSDMTERSAPERKNDFEGIELSLTAEEAAQEASRCLRCDFFGYGAFREGRTTKW